MSDVEYLRRALKLAEKGEGHTRPNPPVGAVIVKRGRIIGEGYHKRCGLAHAEVAAIASARKRGENTEGATLYVTLEPCSKAGRVGACTDAIIASGVKRVVYAARDPNPKNGGKAKRALAKSGVVAEYVALDEAKALIAPFAKRISLGLPFVTVKLAMSLDGKIADNRGASRWISSARSRAITGAMRERVDAIMVGAETVRKDDPLLLSHGRRNDDLLRVVVSRSGKLPKNAKVFCEGLNPTLVYSDAKSALVHLAKLGVMHVLCEGGLALARSLAEKGLVDEWIAVVAPKVIGSRPISKAVAFRGEDCILRSQA